MPEHSGTIDEQQMLVSTFFLGEAAFGLDTAQVQEVVRVGDITPVHHAPGFVLGVMNLRGRIATVIELAVKLELAGSEIDGDSRIFIVEWQDEQIGLLVGRVADAVVVDRSALKPAPENVRGVQGRQFQGVCHVDGRLIALLDMAAVLAVDDGMEAGSARRE
jgi:purine-binding chemotaxis protein CheW